MCPRAAVLHVGVGRPNICIISVKNECGLRAYAGPVLSYYELERPGLDRMTDEEWREMLDTGPEPPRPTWTAGIVR